MKLHRPADTRGTSRHGTRTRLCTFSSGDYHDADWMGFGALRQLNEEHLPAGTTVPAQRVANMELLTLVLDGTLRRDGVALEAGTLAWTGAGHASDTPVEETMKALHDLVQSGKVRYLGASNLRTWQFAEMNRVADVHGWTPFVSMQIEYSLLYRTEVRGPCY